MNSIAFAQQHKIFKRLEAVTNYANLDKAQRLAYDEDLKIYRDFQNCIDFKLHEGIKKGREEGIRKGREEGIKKGEEKGRAKEKYDIVCKLYKNGMPAETIARMLEIPLESVKDIIG